MGFFKKRNIANWKEHSHVNPKSDSEQPQIFSNLEQNIEEIKKAFGKSKDLVMEELCFLDEEKRFIGLIYLEGMINTSVLQEMIKYPLITNHEHIKQQVKGENGDPLNIILKYIPVIDNKKSLQNFKDLYDAILSGQTVVLVNGYNRAFTANTSGEEKRAIEEPSTQTLVRGPRDGFTESIQTNISLIRKKIKSPNLWLETMTIGKVTQTKVGIMYINGIANEKIVEEVRIRLSRIDIDGILESGNIEELIQDETFTVFPTLYNTERPDVIASGLLEGRVAILVDGTPFVLIAPVFFVQFFQSAEDYYQRAEFATLIRIIRYICFFISLLAPSLYIAVTTFHQELLPSPLLYSLASQREGAPFPAFLEAVIMEVTFEILREAGVRLPKTVGQAISIVGALVIGQAAVEAGLVSPAMVIVVAITAISNFVIPSFSMGISIRILRFMLMIFSSLFGLFGTTVGLIAIVQHLCSLRSFGVPYMAPFAPFILSDQKDTIFRMPQWALFSRPRFISRKNINRENNATPKKPE